ncbi:MAG TPA: SMC family ATPase [Acidimicrobiia bacterium]|nr:SMC family ATPase [Acidimicrobiia bacterium]
MRVTRLSLRNFRVFADLDLEIPPGVVGIYGPNGAGKSTLVESILWTLFGVARTAKDALRSDGATGETSATVEFEHDGHLYEVTRALSGAANGVKAEASCDGLRVAAGAVAVRQYVHHVLGMSAEAFRSSVFCEQKQLDAFSGRRPEERRKLVLDLLGITPLDRARDSARAQARSALEQIEAARSVLGDLEGLAAEAAHLDERLVAAQAVRVAAEAALTGATEAEAAAAERAAEEERRKQERDRLAALYAAAKRRNEEANQRLAARQAELADLDAAAEQLPALTAAASVVAELRSQLDAVVAHDAARERLAKAEGELAAAAAAGPSADQPANPDPLGELEGLEQAAADASRNSGEAAGRVTAAEAALTAARARLKAADAEAKAAGSLDPEAPCPLCGQELGASFDEVQRHRDDARRAAADAVAAAGVEVDAARAARLEAEQAEQVATTALRRARRQHERLATLQAEVSVARTGVAEAETVVASRFAAAGGTANLGGTAADASSGSPARQPETGRRTCIPTAESLRHKAKAAEAARDAALRLEERLKGRSALADAVSAESAAVRDSAAEAARLLADGKALRFDARSHADATAARAAAAQAVEQARGALTEARLDERGLSERLSERRARLDAEVARRAELAGRETEARHLGRLAELLAEFRNSLVSQVGPALSAQTTALFRELTDGRFDSLEVDGDTFELRVGSAGHPLDRHSGSETDLANLSLRVAIGEQVNLLSGGAVGLLVLDEVLGALDGEHRDRLLGALTRLGARFRQVLVVTHAADVKEQLPYAIEVQPMGGGRSRAACATGRIRLAEVG